LNSNTAIAPVGHTLVALKYTEAQALALLSQQRITAVVWRRNGIVENPALASASNTLYLRLDAGVVTGFKTA